jgi:hypothetical protein
LDSLRSGWASNQNEKSVVVARLPWTLKRDMNTMRFRAKYVSASGNGEYYQVAFANTDLAGEAADVDGPDSSYLLIQRQFGLFQ